MRKLLPRKEVEQRTNQSTATLYRKMAAGTFPRPVKAGGRVSWLESEIDTWIAARVNERDAAHPEAQIEECEGKQ